MSSSFEATTSESVSRCPPEGIRLPVKRRKLEGIEGSYSKKPRRVHHGHHKHKHRHHRRHHHKQSKRNGDQSTHGSIDTEIEDKQHEMEDNEVMEMQDGCSNEDEDSVNERGSSENINMIYLKRREPAMEHRKILGYEILEISFLSNTFTVNIPKFIARANKRKQKQQEAREKDREKLTLLLTQGRDVEERVYTEGNMGMGMGNIETPTEGMGMGMYPSYPLFEEKRDYGEMRERVRKYRTHGNRAKSVDLNIQIPDDLEVHVPKSSSMMMLDAPYLPVTPKPLIGNSNQRPLRMLANLTAQYNFTIKQIFRNRKSLTFSKSGDHWETLCLNPALPDHFRITAKVTKIDAFDGMIFFGIIAGNQLDFNATFKSKVPWDKGQCAYYSDGNISYFDREIRAFKVNSGYEKGDLVSIMYDGSKVIQFELNGCKQKMGFGRMQGNLHFVAGMNTKGSEVQVLEVLTIAP